MGIFSMRKKGERYGVIIDVGSGSVLGAIIHSKPGESHPTIVWAYREQAPLRNIDSMNQSAKAVMAALVNVSMKIDSEARKVLAQYDSSAKLTELQCSIAAPWSYTVSKSIHYNQEEKFRITQNLIEDLTLSAQQKIDEDLKENESVSNLGLMVIARTVISLMANGYFIRDPEGEFTKTLSLTQTTVVGQQYLVDVIEEMREKLFQNTKTKKLSFVLMLYCVSRDLLPDKEDVALVDVTNEATEIGIVREGVLRYCTHASFGIASLAREIGEVAQVPLHEAFGYLHSDTPYAFMDRLPETQKEEVERIFDMYIDRISQLFHETGDTLAIPKHMALHTDMKVEPLFGDLLEKAAHRATKLKHRIIPISKTIFEHAFAHDTKIEDITSQDTALLLSAQFFHKQNHCVTFEFL